MRLREWRTDSVIHVENYGILFSIPTAFIATAVYRGLLLLAVGKYHWISRLFRPVSYLVLGHWRIYFCFEPTKWFIVLPLCTVFAILVLLQYDVSDNLYGINGDDGPYTNMICVPGRQFTSSLTKVYKST
jgi:hypothetical protein